MGVLDGQSVSAATTNPAFINKNIDDTMPNKLGFNRPMSGTAIADIQQAVNNLYSATGVSETQDGTQYNAPAGTVDNGDPYQTAIALLAGKFDAATGHHHSGAPGDGPPIAASAVGGVPLTAYIEQLPAYGVTGSSTDVSTLFAGKLPSTSVTSAGVPVTPPYNQTYVLSATGATFGQELTDTGNNRVYGRVTYSSSVWTMNYYAVSAGIETPYTFPKPTVLTAFYQELFNPLMANPGYSQELIAKSSTAGGGGGGTTFTVTAGVSLAANTAVYISVGSADGGRTAGDAYPLDPTNPFRVGFVGFTTAAIGSGGTGTVQGGGGLQGFTGLTPGAPYYGSVTTPGSIQSTVPSGGNQFVVGVGTALSATTLVVEVTPPTPALGYTSKIPSVQTYTGSGNITIPSGPAPLYLRVKLRSAGGGGAGSGSSGSAGNGGNGGSSTFGSYVTLTGGQGAIASSGGGAGTDNQGGAGGTVTLGAPAIVIFQRPGASGDGSQHELSNSIVTVSGGRGGGEGGGGGGASNNNGQAGATGSGGGGGGGGNSPSIGFSGAGGGEGAYAEFIVPNPIAGSTIAYSVGTGGTGGATGSVAAGGAGADGSLSVEMVYPVQTATTNGLTPTVKVITSSTTYVPGSGGQIPLFLKVKAQGAGGGGGGAGGGGNGTAGGTTTFGSLITCNGGGFGYGNNGGSYSSIGGAATINSPAIPIGVPIQGSGGTAGTAIAGNYTGGPGGVSPFGGSGAGSVGSGGGGGNASPNSGSGGGGGGSGSSGGSGAGGAAGGTAEAFVIGPAASYTVTIGAGGPGGSGTDPGGNGADGIVIVEEYYALPSSVTFSIGVKTANYTANASDSTLVCNTSGGAFTVTLPDATLVTGQKLLIIYSDTNFTKPLTVASVNSQIIGGGSNTSTTLNTSQERLELQSDGSRWQILSRTWDKTLYQYTPVINNFGSGVSNVKVFSARDGDCLIVQGKLTVGSSVPGSTAEIAIGAYGQPTDGTVLVFDSTKLDSSGENFVGEALTDGSASVTTFPIISQGGGYFLLFGSVGSGGSFTPMNGNAFLPPGGNFSFYARIPIAGWKGL